MDAWTRDDAVDRAAQQRRFGELSTAPADVSGPVSAAAPGSHLLCGEGGDCGRRTTTHAASARGLRPSAARGRHQGRLAFFFELAFFGWAQPRRGAQGLSVIEEWQVAHVLRHQTGRRFFLDDDRDGATLDAFSKSDAAAAGETSVRESLHHRSGSY